MYNICLSNLYQVITNHVRTSGSESESPIYTYTPTPTPKARAIATAAVPYTSVTFFGLPPTFNLVGSPPPTSVCKPFLTRRFGLICMSHVIRLDAKQSAKGCATCMWLEGATTCGVIQCYPMASGVESQGGPRGSTTHAHPLPAYPSPRPRKIAIIWCVCACLCVCRYSIVTIKSCRA